LQLVPITVDEVAGTVLLPIERVLQSVAVQFLLHARLFSELRVSSFRSSSSSSCS